MQTLAEVLNEKFVNPFLNGRNRIGSNPQIVIKNVTLTTKDNVRTTINQIIAVLEVLQKCKSITNIPEAEKKLTKKVTELGIAP